MNHPNAMHTPIELLRDCVAVLIPEGTNITLIAGTEVRVTQALGGAVTVNVNGNLARIAAADVDALGMEATALPAERAQAAADGSVDSDLIWEQLSTCYDPEIPINIVELGLIYRCEIKPVESGGNRVEIDLTLTAPGCGMGPFLVDDVRAKVAQVPNVSTVEIELVFDPPWNKNGFDRVAVIDPHQPFKCAVVGYLFGDDRWRSDFGLHAQMLAQAAREIGHRGEVDDSELMDPFDDLGGAKTALTHTRKILHQPVGIEIEQIDGGGAEHMR